MAASAGCCQSCLKQLLLASDCHKRACASPWWCPPPGPVVVLEGMAFLLDTTVVSELRRSSPHGGVVVWIESVDDAELYLGSVTIGETQAGIELSCDHDAAKADAIERWLD